MPAAATIDLPPRYRDPRHLANGGMAAVYAAEDAVLGRRVAIKVLAAHFAEDPAAVQRFQREARAAARVSGHPHVVTIYDVGEHGGRPFIVMQLMDGGSLARVLRAGPPPRADALRWIAEAASALDAAHELDIVHRDVKPGNLLLDARGRLGVADFGIARLAYESAVTLTGQVLGTAAYIAPEQAAGEGATSASDRYALAVVAHELLTGTRPGSDAPELPAALDGVLQRGLARDPEARWGSANEFAQALTRAAGDDETEITQPLAAEAATTRAVPAAAGARGDRPPPVSPPARARRRPPRWLPLALVGLMLLLAGVFAIASGGGDGERADTPAEPEQRQPAPREEAPSGGAASGAPATGQSAEPSVAQLNDQGFALMNQGRHDEAIPLLEQAVERCGDSRETVCAYALYNLGRSLRLAGRPAEAIPILERRLTYDNQTDVVQAELDAARAAVDGEESSGEGSGGDDDRGGGKGRGKGKKGDD